MRANEILEKLQEDITVPDIVQKKADMAFEEVRRQSEGKRTSRTKKTGGKMTRKKIILCIAAAVLMVGGICLAANYKTLSRRTEKVMHISKKQKEEIENQVSEIKKPAETGSPETEEQQQVKEQLVDLPDASATDQGVTISVQDCIVDNYCLKVVFKIEGYERPEGGWQPDLVLRFYVDGEAPEASGGGSFYDGRYTNNNGDMLEDGAVENYMFEDGSMEYVISLMSHEKGYFLGKQAHVEVKEFGYYTEKAGALHTDLEGSWILDWTLQGTSEVYEADIENGNIGDTGMQLVHVELSPISAKVLIDAEKKEITEEYMDDNGETAYHETWEVPIYLSGVKMKDGSVYYFAYNGAATMEYRDGLFMHHTEAQRILDVDEIEALLFQKDAPEPGPDGRFHFTDDNFYFVNIR